MKKIIRWRLMIFLLFITHFTFAQTVDEIISKYIEARGGQEKINAISTISMNGNCVQFGKGFTVKKNIEQGKFYREDKRKRKNKISLIATDHGVWAKERRRFKKMSDSIAFKYEFRYDIQGVLVNYKAKGHKVELLGSDTAMGQQCYKLKFIGNDGVEIIFWIDRNSFLNIQCSYIERSSIPNEYGKYITSFHQNIITYKDFKSVQGILFPYTELINMYDNTGGIINTINTYYETIEINKPIPSKLYPLK